MTDLQNIYNSTIGKGTKIAQFVEIGGSVIGNGCKIQAFAFIPPGTVIGDHVFIGPHVCFCNVKRPKADVDQRHYMVGATVHSGATIGANSTILPGVVIGENAFVGAGSVVTKDVPANTMVFGNPAKIIKSL